MPRTRILVVGIGLMVVAFSRMSAQEQTTAIRAGRLFDAKAGTMLTNQVVLIRGDRIADVGANLAVPAGARVIDLSPATVLPGMIDAHVHVALNVPNESVEHHTFVMIQSAQRDLDAGFTGSGRAEPLAQLNFEGPPSVPDRG